MRECECFHFRNLFDSFLLDPLFSISLCAYAGVVYRLHASLQQGKYTHGLIYKTAAETAPRTKIKRDFITRGSEQRQY